MFIIWGKKRIYRTLGYVADYCPTCRSPKAFELQRVGIVSHVYYLSFGEGRLAGHQRTCKACGTSLDANPTTYASVSPKPMALPELIEKTFPNLLQTCQPILALEEKIKKSPNSLSASERHAVIRGPMLSLSAKVEKRFASTHIDKETGLALLGGIVAFIVGLIAASRFAPTVADKSSVIILVLGILLVAWQGLGSRRRFMRREIIPVVVKTIGPVKPTESEVKAVLAELKATGHKIGAKLKASDLMVALGLERPAKGLVEI
jgi:hypothetical protein